MYRTLLATCGSAEMKITYYIMVYPDFVEPHVASNVRYIAFQ